MRKAEYYIAVYGILENEKGEILMMERKNTGFMDGKYGLPAGHLEWYETLKEGVVREIQEEISIIVKEKDLELIHTSHRITHWDRVYLDFYFRIHKYSGEISNGEPEKCSNIRFLDKQNSDIVPYLKDIFQYIQKWKTFSEIHINS